MNDSTPRADLHETVTKHLDREITSGEALGTRAAGLVGFCGVILALAATLGRDALSRELGSVGGPVAKVAFVLAVLVIFAAAAQAVLMLTPRQRGRTDPQVLRVLRGATDPEAEIHDRLSKSAITIYADEATKNDARGRALRRAYGTLLIGLGLVAAQAAIVGASGTEEPCKTETTVETTTTTTLKTSRKPLPSKTTRAMRTSSGACEKVTGAKRSGASSPAPSP